MKKISTLATLVASFVLALAFSSCLSSDGENSQTFAGEPLVVDQTSPSTVLANQYRIPFIAPQLDQYFYSVGDCLLGNFKIDYDQQSSSDRYTITDFLAVQKINRILALPGDTVSAAYQLPINDIQLYGASSQATLIKNVIFIVAGQKANQGKNFTYQARFGEEENLVQNGYPTLYLSATANVSTETSSQEILTPFAIDLTEFIFASSHLISSDKLTFNIKYRISTDEASGASFSQTYTYSIQIPKENTDK